MWGSTLLIHQHIALRWSAKKWLASKAINIWLLWSQSIVWLRSPRFYVELSVGQDWQRRPTALTLH